MGGRERQEARCAVEKASKQVEKGDAEGALRLLEHAQRLHPRTPGLPELVALAQVCHAASCSATPLWSRILMVSEKDDLTAIRKRYRQLALLLHPDKNKHARAEEAFKLVSEAYGHLSDGKKQETSHVNIHKKEFGKCSFESQPSCWDSMRCNGEPLKGKINQTAFQRCFFPFDFRTAEWKIEHEKLRIFRERAQAKVDSLAQILKERRSKWNEEFGTTKCGLKEKSYCNSDGSGCRSEVFNHRSQSAPEKKGFNSQSHVSGGDQNGALKKAGASKKAGDSFLNTNQKLSQILSDGVRTSFVDRMSGKEVGSRMSRQKQGPPVLQSLHGLLRIVKEEMGDSFNVSFEGTADAKPADKQQNKETQAHEMNDDAACHSHNHWVNCGCSNKAQGKNKLEEEWIVIDDFLAGLNEIGQQLSTSRGMKLVSFLWLQQICFQHQLYARQKYKIVCNDWLAGQTFERAEEKCALSETAIGRASSSFVRSYSRKTRNDAEDCISSLKEQPTTTWLQAHKRTLERVAGELEPWNKLKRPLKDRIVSSACAQNKQSEQQLLMTLERLRDETKSIATTLERMKEARIFPGNCHVPASIIAT